MNTLSVGLQCAPVQQTSSPAFFLNAPDEDLTYLKHFYWCSAEMAKPGNNCHPGGTLKVFMTNL